MRSYPCEKFRRLTGVKRNTFELMVEVFCASESQRRGHGGPKPKLSNEDSVLAALSYWREYRTFMHIAADYGLSESQIFRIIRRVEDTLIKSNKFSLPGKKSLLKSEFQYEVVLIDATETPIERPKRGKKAIFLEKSDGIR